MTFRDLTTNRQSTIKTDNDAFNGWVTKISHTSECIVLHEMWVEHEIFPNFVRYWIICLYTLNFTR